TLSPNTDPLGGIEGLPCAPNPFACFVNPLLAQNNQYTSAASSFYEGLILDVKKRCADHFTMFGTYTFSKGLDTAPPPAHASPQGFHKPRRLGCTVSRPGGVGSIEHGVDERV